MCEFQSLYYNDDGYVVRCNQCSHYQVAYSSIMLTLTDYEFGSFYKLIEAKKNDADYCFSPQSKCVVLQTPAQGVCILLTQAETQRFFEILEEADNEMKALTLINMFNV